ncbi:MAG: DUF4277 domain-containing protein [Moorea sp. SIO2B7]|nr:DUF4277 domain-containing protein [Moorena sp. SIO2B7]
MLDISRDIQSLSNFKRNTSSAIAQMKQTREPIVLTYLKVQDIDHCGIVAGIIDEMGLVEEVNKELGTHSQEITRPRVSLKAMILNGLGLVSRAHAY